MLMVQKFLLKFGQAVTQGTPVLKVGSTGYSTGPHAHFEIRVNGEYLNPMDYLIQTENSSEEDTTETVELDSNEENN